MLKTCDSVLEGEPSIEELVRYVKAIGVRDDHDAHSLAHDALLDGRAKGYRFRKVKFLTYNYFEREIAPREENLTYLDQPITDDGMTHFDFMEYDYDIEIRATKQANQRQLISELVSGSDERTKEIVRTWMNCDKPTISNVSRELGIHKQTVSRCLKRLKRKYTPGRHNCARVSFYA